MNSGFALSPEDDAERGSGLPRTARKQIAERDLFPLAVGAHGNDNHVRSAQLQTHLQARTARKRDRAIRAR